jgi:serine/threonine-protein kinase
MDPENALEGGRISGYEIQGKLGAGGMGVVYKAVDTKLGRTVALKFLPAEAKDSDARERFLQEAKAASALDHPNIGTIHSIEETPAGQPFIVMAYYEGESLAQRIARGPLAWKDAVSIAIQMGEALAAAHAKGIVHRDVKPANVMLTREGTAKVVDFGLAKMAGSAALTQTGQAVGTADYMSPEQAMGQGWDARSDIWAWGVVLYEMLTGRRPFEGTTAPSLLYQVVHAEPPTLTIGVPALEAVCRRAMAKAPAHRYPGMADAVADRGGREPDLDHAGAADGGAAAPAADARALGGARGDGGRGGRGGGDSDGAECRSGRLGPVARATHCGAAVPNDRE